MTIICFNTLGKYVCMHVCKCKHISIDLLKQTYKIDGTFGGDYKFGQVYHIPTGELYHSLHPSSSSRSNRQFNGLGVNIVLYDRLTFKNE